MHYFSRPLLWIIAFEWIPVAVVRFLRGSLFTTSVHKPERIQITLEFDRACLRSRLALKLEIGILKMFLQSSQLKCLITEVPII